jgi:hypothetical protein
LPLQPGVSGGAGNTKFVMASSSPPSGTPASATPSYVARPSLYKRLASVDVETAYYPNMDGQVFASRFLPGSTNPASDWAPKKFYDPWDAYFASVDDAFGRNTGTPIGYVNKSSGLRMETNCSTQLGKPGPANPLMASTLPIATRLGIALDNCDEFAPRRPVFAQAKVASKFDSAGVVPDIFVGTGDSNQLGNTNERNFFYAVHDSGFSDPTAPLSSSTITNRGALMWIYAFDKGEKVVGNPTFAGGSLVVATYKPPVSGSTCKQFGDAYLYAFDPKTGQPRKALQDPASPAGAPVYKSVIELKDAGALSDLITIKGSNQVGYATSGGAPQLTAVRTFIQAGRVQGWKRVK